MPEDNGDFDRFVAARTPALIRLAYLFTGDWHLAEDLLQTALMRCYPRWSGVDSPEAYVRRTMVTTVTGWRRRRWNAERPTAQLPERADSDPGSEAAVRTDVLRLLRALGPRQRTVLVLRFYEDLSEAEVAALMGTTIGTVKSQTARALDRLRGLRGLQALVRKEVQ
jgi:RNA polymerase sigma-70 factor (sigma-E family)